jgi:ParB/RepB/Spo0J family partition protein
MSRSRGAWINRRGQADVDRAIDLVIAGQPQPGEHVQLIADELIEDSPYQARHTFDARSVDDLAQGMRESGFQGVLIVRPHGDPTKRQHGLYQLVYGHCRRIAWRSICMERGEPCRLATVVRAISDAQLLTIGAQENLQRQDLDPVEEAQIIAWLERMFFDKNQAEIGAMLGKSADWVSVRSRIHKLPDVLKERLRQRPRAITQMLDLGILYTHQPQLALDMADRVVNEHLTVEAARALVVDHTESRLLTPAREKRSNRRDNTTSIGSTDKLPIRSTPPRSATCADDTTTAVGTSQNEQPAPDASSTPSLDAVAGAFAALASQADEISGDATTLRHVEVIEQALLLIRRAAVRRTLPSSVLARNRAYRLHNTELSELVLLLRQHHTALAVLHPTLGKGQALNLLLCRVPTDARPAESPRQGTMLFVATLAKGSAIVPAIGSNLGDWARQHLKLSQPEAVMATALLRDLQKIFLVLPL